MPNRSISLWCPLVKDFIAPPLSGSRVAVGTIIRQWKDGIACVNQISKETHIIIRLKLRAGAILVFIELDGRGKHRYLTL